MATCRYTIILDRESEGGFHAYCPALKGCHSQGDTLDEATDNMREAIEGISKAWKRTASRFRGRTC